MPKEILPVPSTKLIDDNVWQWIQEVGASSPVQPIANLGTGFIEYNPPEFLTKAHKDALNTVENNQYAPVTGTSNLRKAIVDVYSPLFGKQIDPVKEVCVTSGAQEALLSCIMSYIRPGDEVILFEPVFEMYVFQIKWVGGVIRYVPLRPPETSTHKIVSGNDWTFDIKDLVEAVTPKTKMIVLNNPHNPLGKIFTPEELRTIGSLCVEHGIILLSDEVYERIAFANQPYSSKTLPHIRTATISPEVAAITLTTISLGKLFNATGWRAGFVVGPEKLVKPVIGTHALLTYASSSPAQEAFAMSLREAGTNGWWARNAEDVAVRVGRICSALDEVGLTYVAPAGAYFILVNVERIVLPESYNYPQIVVANRTRDWKVCYFLVQEFGVTCIPGSCFYGPESRISGESYVRFGACKSDEGLQLAEERIRKMKSFVRGTA